ncbi:AtpZ/AtpI family protein [Thiomicrorhabdus heinhorstiae]|uniref:AtpZ/AtpI family protein n=1 Tax=Thiomicrorhabdus heinhorstiae TaxID=2748010 RepID=A0ABS0BV55_9GAMM|nr:AtpZ/AtpI family protein [Thiomicrorhabdus heinhorstiae]MBF6057712.1 AtpZ/AtpI family protein [Thiomicrorhabdus heinhorstiae]
MNDKTELKKEVEHQIDKMEAAKEAKPTLLAQTVYLGTIGLLLVIPIVGGAYLGHWLDERVQGIYSISWSINLILIGVAVGALNVYLFIKRT